MSEDHDAAVACLREYLQGFAECSTPDRSFEALLYQAGTVYPPPPRPRPKGFRKMRDKSCFGNAFATADSKGWTYVEGYALSADPVFPVQHGWCLDGEGTVVEPTWEEPALAYIGMPLNFELVARVVAQQKFLPVFPAGTRIWKDYCSERARRAAQGTV